MIAFASPADAAPDTKMKDLMKQVGKLAASETDATKLVFLLTQAKAMKPTIAEMGPLFDATLKAAGSGDMKATNATCGACHKTGGDDSARAKYRRQYGSKAP